MLQYWAYVSYWLVNVIIKKTGKEVRVCEMTRVVCCVCEVADGSSVRLLTEVGSKMAIQLLHMQKLLQHVLKGNV